MLDTIKLPCSSPGSFWELAVLFQDEHLVALVKPVGLPVTPEADQQEPALMPLLHAAIQERKGWAMKRGWSFLAHSHHLDSELGGVLLLARNKEALASLADLFGSERPFRQYVALVQGKPAEPQFEIDAPVGTNPAKPEAMRIDRGHGKRSKTSFTVEKEFRDCTLLRCSALTDRPHQVRVHLRYAKVPALGDHLYGGRSLLLSSLKPGYRLKPHATERPLLGTPAVYLENIQMPHPISGTPIDISAPWTKDINVAVKYLERYAPAPLA